MSDEKLTDLSERVTRQEERMNTHQAKYEGALERLLADMAKRDADMAVREAKRDADTEMREAKRDADTEMREAKRDAEMAKRDADTEMREAKRDAEMARRDKYNTRWIIGMWIANIVVLSVLFRISLMFG